MNLIPYSSNHSAETFNFRKSKRCKEKSVKTGIKRRSCKALRRKRSRISGSRTAAELERVILLKVIDQKWMDHIDDMDQLRQGIGLQVMDRKIQK